jgi:hypothetical protein
MLGKEFNDVLQTTMGRTPPLGQTTVPVVGQGVQEQWLTQLDGGRGTRVFPFPIKESFDCPITNIFGTGGTPLKKEA